MSARGDRSLGVAFGGAVVVACCLGLPGIAGALGGLGAISFLSGFGVILLAGAPLGVASLALRARSGSACSNGREERC